MIAVVIALAALVSSANSGGMHDHAAGAHRGVPSRIVADRRVGPYVVSVWTDADVGRGTIYVVLHAADGLGFTPPSAARVGVAPTSGRLPELVREAHPQHVRRGARFMADVAFDRAERWNVRVVIEGPAGGGELVSQVEAMPNAMLGRFGLVLSSVPFLLVAVVWWRAATVRKSRISKTAGAAAGWVLREGARRGDYEVVRRQP